MFEEKHSQKVVFTLEMNDKENSTKQRGCSEFFFAAVALWAKFGAVLDGIKTKRRKAMPPAIHTPLDTVLLQRKGIRDDNGVLYNIK